MDAQVDWGPPPAAVLHVRDHGRRVDGSQQSPIQAQVLVERLEQAQLVVAIHDREARIDADLVPVPAQEERSEAVEGARPDPGTAGQSREAALEDVGRLVREGDGEDRVRRATAGDQPSDAVGQHAGLARPCAGDDEEAAARIRDRTPLGRVELPQQGVVARRGVRVRRHPGCRL